MSAARKFIVLDGIDGCGKSTQAARLCEALARDGVRAVHLREPGGTRFGEALRTVLLSKNLPRGVRAEMLTFFASRVQLLDEAIEPALVSGAAVVCERWVSSTYAYQAEGGGPDAPDETALVSALERLVVARSPDICIILDLPAAEALARMSREHDGIESRGSAYLERVRAGFLAYAAQRPFARAVSAARPPDDVAADVWHIVNNN